MNTFQEIPATKNSLAKRKLVFGVGINNADYKTLQRIDGKLLRCPFYAKWVNMLTRCYCAKFKVKQPTYHGCTVALEWLTFSNFKAWMIQQDWQGKDMDKDLLVQGNKVYSPSTCLFVSRAINMLLISRDNDRGLYPQGVSYSKYHKKYDAQCSVNSKRNFIGYYKTPEAAHEAYKAFKYKVIEDVALQQQEPLRSALLNYKIN